MKYINKVQEALKEVYSFKKYFLVTFSVALAIFLFNTLVNNYRILFSDFSFSLFFSLLKGALASMTALSFILLIIMSVLAGVVTTMTIFLVKRQVKGSLKAGTSSIFISLIAPACPSCAIGLLSVLGFGGFLAVLPFKGLELGFLGIGLLGASIVYLSNKIATKTCNIAQKEVNMENNNVSVKKSTIWKLIVVVLIAVFGFLALKGNLGSGITGNVIVTSNNDPYADLPFKEVCAKTGGMWMKMQPTQNNDPTGQSTCLGCMLRNGDHICEKGRYIQALQLK
mgnify:CR=1 FL=1